eukprot:c18657_g2_i2 orf=373-744(-)
MGRGVSYGGGQSSLGYLFGSGEPPKVTSVSATAADAAPAPAPAPALAPAVKESPLPSNQEPPTLTKTTPDPNVAAGQLVSNMNNYHRAEGQNTGNFITDRPSTKVHAAPGGGSSLGYLFGGGD